jgi:hypothetical protein
MGYKDKISNITKYKKILSNNLLPVYNSKYKIYL